MPALKYNIKLVVHTKSNINLRTVVNNEIFNKMHELECNLAALGIKLDWGYLPQLKGGARFGLAIPVDKVETYLEAKAKLVEIEENEDDTEDEWEEAFANSNKLFDEL